jgi:integrase
VGWGRAETQSLLGIGGVSAIETASPQLKIALMLGRYIGIPVGKMLELPWSAYNGQRIEYRRMKEYSGSRAAALRVEGIPEQAAAARHPDVLNRRRKPFTGDGFRGSLFRVLQRVEAEKKVQPGLTSHGFTRTRRRDIFNAGGTKLEVMAAVGHTTPKMVDLYSQEIDRERQAERRSRLR